MSAALTLTASQIEALAPLFRLRGSCVLVAAVHPNGSDWQLDVHALPGERRDAIRAACDGSLKIPRAKKPKQLGPVPHG